MTAEDIAKKTLDKKLKELGPSKAVERFLQKYGKVRTRATYATELAVYLRWLRTKDIGMTPDELVKDNLLCVYKSDPVDVATKRRHTDLLSEYVNKYLIERGDSESKRIVCAAAIRGFYKSNDSALFGDYRTASQEAEAPAKPLFVEDIRRVLPALPLRVRVPLLISWQTGIEINRVLTMRFPSEGKSPLKVELHGRKGHKQSYWTYLGADSVKHLQMLSKGFATYDNIRHNLKSTARRLAPHLKNPELRSWHPHMLRHSFAEEARHARVEPEVREFFLGHLEGIKWVYLHGELHEEDFLREYGKLEPAVSLEPDKVTIQSEYEGREKTLRMDFEALKRNFEELKELLQSKQSAAPSPR